MIGLTPQQARTLAIIKDLTRDQVPPSFREIQLELGLNSISSVTRLLHGLRDRGAITFVPRQSRSIRVLDDGDGLADRTTAELLALRGRINRILKGRGH